MADDQIGRNPSGAYVYEILVDGVVRYVGKGRGDRARRHISKAHTVNRRRAAGETVKTQKFYNRLAKALRSGAKATWRIVQDGLTDAEAFDLEIQTIAAHGSLWNTHAGGQGVDSRHAKSAWADPEIRAKYLAFFRSEKYRAQAAKAAAEQWADPDARARAAEIARQRWCDPDIRERQSRAIRAAKTPDSKAAASERQSALWADPEFKRLQSERIRAALAARAPELKQEAARKRAQAITPEKRAEMARKQSVTLRASERYRAAMAAEVAGGQRPNRTRESWNDPEVRRRRTEGVRRAWAERKARQCFS